MSYPPVEVSPRAVDALNMLQEYIRELKEFPTRVPILNRSSLSHDDTTVCSWWYGIHPDVLLRLLSIAEETGAEMSMHAIQQHDYIKVTFRYRDD